ncbi:MAG: leucine--tRNA ligase [Candidatus Thorarchaeota archaeon]
MNPKNYDYKKSEKKWQEKWSETGLFEADMDRREKYFINFPIPYLNGPPHVGHGYTLLKAEAMARYQRMLGKNVLWPFGVHATGEPIVGAAKRVKAGDKSQIKIFKISGVSEEDISRFRDPEYIVEYFKKKWYEEPKTLGLAIDWRRSFVTTQITPTFSKYIEWQYRKLKRDGFVIQGSHPVIWCPADQSPTGAHDRLEGDEARVVDFVVLKFYSETHDAYFLPATLRPETIYGVTNIFIHPAASYIKAVINKENVIISKDVIIKFQDQKFDISTIKEISTSDLIGTYVINPVTGKKVIVLPGDFIDVAGSTGVVMSVPAHAPMDWITLKNLKDEPENLIEWGITSNELISIEPIALIKVEGYGEFPAGEEIEKRNISSRDDPEVKKATRTIYRKEYNSGILLEITGKYKGMTVETVKDKIIADFVNKKIAFILKEPSEPVVCRCGTRNHVKFLENQWFLKFSDQKWKEKTHTLLDRMAIFPEEARKAFHNTVNWLENKACARRSGLGTPMPWDTDWIIETLSDSVIYMAYYIISKYVNEGRFTEEFSTDDVFEYILLGNGEPLEISEKVGMVPALLKEIRKELLYFYPFNLRVSGIDLLTNHLTFMLMHHTAIFPEEFWPLGIAVNGWVKIDDRKMSKRFGNFKTIKDVVRVFGADATRIGFLIAGEGLKDASFALAEAEGYVKWIENLYEMALEEVDDNKELLIDKWLISRVQNHIRATRNYLSRMETRSAFQSAYHEMIQNIKWYLKRRRSKGPAYSYALENMILLVCPFIPHVVEEIWSIKKKSGFASNASFPEVDETKINKNAEYAEKFLNDLIDDIKNLRNFLLERENRKLEKIELFIAPKWMFPIYSEAQKNGLEDLIKRVMTNPEYRKIGKPAVKYAQDLINDRAPPDFPWSQSAEIQTLNEAQNYVETQAKVSVEIIEAIYSIDPKAKDAVPRRPGIKFIMK